MDDINDLTLLINSDVPIITIESYDEKRVLEVITRIAMKLRQSLSTWTVTSGLERGSFGTDVPKEMETTDPETALRFIKEKATDGVYVFCDMHPFLDNPKIVRLLKDIALDYALKKQTIFLLSYALTMPPEIQRLSAWFELRLPTDEELMAIVREEAAEWSKRNNNQHVKTDNNTLKKIIANLRGLSFDEARRLARSIIVDDGALTEEDIGRLNKAKFELLDMEGVLSFEYQTAQFSDVGGLSKLKTWLMDRRDVFINSTDSSLESPKGILLLGVQGGGKSLAAKAVAGLWHIPLLRMDMGALYNKYIGESEKNLREALKLAEMMAPCVMWLDEIEKGFAAIDADSGTSQRLLGTLLTWMAERKRSVFIVATANDITCLPPELIRKGRLDEIFFVDLPNKAIREQIFKIHLEKRGVNPNDFDLSALADASEGFSGAEIEQAIVSALYCAAATKTALSTTPIISQLCATSPLSVVMAEKMEELRAWAKERTVFAD